MRDYKFRGKRRDNGEWLVGDLYQSFYDGAAIINPPRSPLSWSKCIVDSFSVGQYTGLKDRNGKEIYEGDIIEVRGRYKRVVIWDKIGYALRPCEEYHDKTFWVMNIQHPGEDWWDTYRDEIEVIGNIHDNPEMLKGGEE